MSRIQQRVWIVAFALAVVLAPASRAYAVWDNIGQALGFIGFDLQGRENILSGGADFRMTNQFQGQTFDFGIAEFNFTGPLSFEVSTGNRWLDTIDLRMQTALFSDAASQPLAYSAVYDVGGQATTITGDLFIDADLSMNAFGFYDLNMIWSSRQEIDYDGRFANGNPTNDFDIGPIDISGNIFADMIGLLVDPLFEAAGVTNPFYSFSGRAQLEKAIEKALLANAPLTDLGADGFAPDMLPSTIDGSLQLSGPPATRTNAIPEPAAIVLMALGAPLLASRWYRRR